MNPKAEAPGNVNNIGTESFSNMISLNSSCSSVRGITIPRDVCLLRPLLLQLDILWNRKKKIFFR